MSEHARRLAEALAPFGALTINDTWGDKSILARGDYEQMKVGDFRRAIAAIAAFAAYRASDEYREDAERHAAEQAGFQGLSDPKRDLK